MTIDDYFHKTLLMSIIVGPALTMTLPLVYWVQYRNMLFFPSFLYYVTGTGSVSMMLYFFIYILPDNLHKLKPKGKKEPTKQMLFLPPPTSFIEECDFTEEENVVEPIIYNKVEEVPATLSPSDPDATNRAQQEEATMYKKLYYAFVEKYVKGNMPEEDAQIVLDNIYAAIDNRLLDLITTEQIPHLPFEVKTASKFSGLNTEDICHIGFAVKFFLKKRNEYGAAFIKGVFPHQLKDVEFSTIATKLASSESKNPSIPIPKVCWGDNRNISKRFSGRVTDELIKQI